MAAHLETKRLRLRPLSVEDWPEIHRYMSDPQVTKWLPEGLLTKAQTQAFATRNAGDAPRAIAVISKSTAGLIGHMVFHPWEVTRTHEIGWVFAREQQRHGYATEAAKALIAHAFETLHCHRVIATCQPENVASCRVMEKLGMRREGHFLRCIPRGGDEWWDEYFYAILADEHTGRCSAQL